MTKVMETGEREQYEEWKKLLDSFYEKYGRFYNSLADKEKAAVDALKSHDLLDQVKKGIAEAYNLLMEAKNSLNNTKNRKIAEKYNNFISQLTNLLDNFNEFFILTVNNLHS